MSLTVKSGYFSVKAGHDPILLAFGLKDNPTQFRLYAELIAEIGSIPQSMMRTDYDVPVLGRYVFLGYHALDPVSAAYCVPVLRQGENQLLLQRLVVHPRSRSAGVGRQMLAHIVTAFEKEIRVPATGHPYGSLRAIIPFGQTRAKRFFEANGFQQQHGTEIYELRTKEKP